MRLVPNEHLQERLRAMEESRDGYAALFDFAPIAYLMLDHEGAIQAINLAGATLLGVARDTVVGCSLGGYVLPEDMEIYAKHLRQCGQGAGRFLSERLRVRSKDGRTVPVAVQSEVTFNASGKCQIRTALSDMTQYDQGQREKNEAQLREHSARIAAEMKDRLVAAVSHELRTPLSAILLWARVLSSKLAGNEEYVQGLQAITRSAEAQRSMIDDLLDTSHISSGKLRLELQRVDLSNVFINAVQSLMSTADRKRVTLEAHVFPTVGWVCADAARIRQILLNLVTNAIKFTGPGGHVKASLSRMDGDVYIVVSDDGRGIDRASLSQVFEPFHQTDAGTDRQFGGLGLGLSISQQLAQLHGGHIQASSEGVGHGSAFTLRLPLPILKPGDAPQGEPDAEAVAVQDRVNLSGLHLLLIEDDPNTRAALQRLMNEAGAEVMAFASAGQAIDAFQALRPDLIIGDIGMPGEDGYSLIRRVREIEKAKGSKPVPAIALTAFTQESDKEKALAAGFDRHMGKPVELTTLVSVMRSLVPGS